MNILAFVYHEVNNVRAVEFVNKVLARLDRLHDVSRPRTCQKSTYEIQGIKWWICYDSTKSETLSTRR